MKKALIVGINYVGTGNDLRGCINDAYNMRDMLAARGFTVELMLEKSATTANMIGGMERLVANTSMGDTIVFHYSGHGSQLPSRNEPDGFEEILCPIDLNWLDKVITDDTLRDIFNKAPRGVNTTVILDCCHSGTALDQEESLSIAEDSGFVPVKEVPLEFGGRYLAPPPAILAQLKDTTSVQWYASRDINRDAMLIAGCKAHQTSADAYIDGSFQGAATYSLLKSVGTDKNITYIDLITSMNKFMVAEGFEQEPQLDGWNGLHNQFFAEPWAIEENVVTIQMDDQLPVVEPVVSTKKSRLALGILLLAALGVAFYFMA